jgi:gamma-glutamyltranspeptidase / glutathione hydrolase
MRNRFIAGILLCGALRAQEVSQSGLLLKAERPMVAEPERARHAVVSSANELASRVGIEILKKGGNAVDAAVATGFALAVVHPEAGNLGGGGYMLIRMADGRSKAIDYRETAPAAARPGMYSNPREANVGYKASAIPGTVSGLAMAHRLFGALSWKQVLEPARRLAAEGFPASQRMDIILALQVPVMKDFPETAKVFLHGGTRPLKQGEIVKQPDLAATIDRIRMKGEREFYEGETARRIDADMRAHGGTITYDDLKGYRAIARDPIQGSYRGFGIVAVPPSTSGGFTLLEMLNILELYPPVPGGEGSSRSRHLMIEAMRRAYADRRTYAADPAFFPIPVERLIAKPHAAELARGIDLDHATPSANVAAGQDEDGGDESADTTHFSVIDQAGNVVTNTYTLNGFYGSQVIPKGTGVLFNDIMEGFGTRPGTRGVIAPGKRPVSSMTPVIVLDAEKRPWFALGSPGSATIPNSVMQVIVNVVDFKMSLRDAIEYPRIHHQYLPDRVDAEPGALVLDVAEKLRAMGHTLNPRLRSQGDVHAVAVEQGTGWRLGWSDGRRGGRAAGY